MLVFPNCKINLGLNILNKRADGYHNIETIFYPVPLKDALEIITADAIAQPDFSSSGLDINGNFTDNLCIKAYELLKKDHPSLPSVKIHLYKNIPVGAGLGGGSADAAFTLMLLNSHYGLNLPVTQLTGYALQLGSDCPFFILNEPCIATGRGEILEPLTIDLSDYNLLLVNPGIHINTGMAFAGLKLQPPDHNRLLLKEIKDKPVEAWQHFLKNDFELPVFEKYPLIKEIREMLYSQGAAYASMSGSGSTVYGLFKKPMQPALNFEPDFFVRLVSL